MAHQTQLSTYDQIANAVRKAQEVNDHLKMNYKELPFADIVNMQLSIADYLDTASRLLLEGEPTLLSNFWLELLSFLDTESSAIIAVLLKFLGKAGYYSEDLLASAIQLVIHFFPETKEGAVGYEKAVISAVEDLYVAGFRFMCGLSKSDNLRQAIEIWTNLQHAKEWILQQGLSWKSWSDFTRVSARSFQITLIQLQTFAPGDITSNGDAAYRQMAADEQPSLTNIPNGILFLDRQQLLREAETEIENLLSHGWTDNSFQYTMMTMNMVSRLVKTRPQCMNQCIQWYELMHATMPTDALSQLEAESVVKLMRYQLLHFLAALPAASSSAASADLAYYDRISVLLYDCGADDSQIRRYSTEGQRQQRTTTSAGGGTSRAVAGMNVGDTGGQRAVNDADEDDALVSRRKRVRVAQDSHEDTKEGISLRDEGEKYDATDKTRSSGLAGGEDEDEDDDEAKTAAAAAAGTAATGGRSQMLVEDQFGVPYDLSEPKSAAINYTARHLADMLSLECAVELIMKFQRDVPERSPEAFLSHHFVMRHSEEGVEKQKQHLARVIAARIEAEGVGPGGVFVRQKLFEIQQRQLEVDSAVEAGSGDGDDKRSSKTMEDKFSLAAPGGHRIPTIGHETGGPEADLLARKDRDASAVPSKLSSLISSSLDDEPEPPPSLDYRPSERAFELASTTEALTPAEVEKFRVEFAKQTFSKPAADAQFSRILFSDSYWVVRKSYVFLAARFGGCIRSELCDFLRTNPRQCESLMLQWLATEYLVFSGRYDERLKWHNAKADRQSFADAFQTVLDVLFSTFTTSTDDVVSSPKSMPSPSTDSNNDNELQLFSSEAAHQQFIVDLLNRVIFIPDYAVKRLCEQQFANIPSAPVAAGTTTEQSSAAAAADAKAGRKSSTPVNDSSIGSSSSNSEAVNSMDNNKLRVFHFFMRLFKSLAISRAPQECARYVKALVEPLYVARPDIQRACMNEVIALHQFSVKSAAAAAGVVDSGGTVHIKLAVEKEAVDMLHLLELELPPEKLFEPQYSRTPSPPSSVPLAPVVGAPPAAVPPPPAAAAPTPSSSWTEELVRTCSMLFMKLIQYNANLIEELGPVFVSARPPVKRDLFKAVETPIQALGADPAGSRVLLNFLRNCPVGSEALILKTLNLLTQNGAKPTPEMVDIAWHAYKPSPTSPSRDVRMLMPVIAGLSKQNVFDCMFDICRLADAKTPVRDAVQTDFFDRLLLSGNKVTTSGVSYNFSALDVLVALHDVRPELGVLSYEQLGKAFRHCVEMHADKFTPQIVRNFIEATIDRDKLPPLFMRTLMWAMKVHQQALLLYIISVLQGIAARGPVWLDKGTWEGYKRSLHVGMELDPKRCARLIVQLPPAQLQEILKSNVQIRKRLDAVKQTPGLLDNVSDDVRAVIADPVNGWQPPPALVQPQHQQQLPLKEQTLPLTPKTENPAVVSPLNLSSMPPVPDDAAELSANTNIEDVDGIRPSDIVIGDTKTAEPKIEIEIAELQQPHVQPLTHQQLQPPVTVPAFSEFTPAAAAKQPASPPLVSSLQTTAHGNGQGPNRQLPEQQHVLPLVVGNRPTSSSNNSGNPSTNSITTKPPNSKLISAKVEQHGSSVDRVIGKIISMPKQQTPTYQTNGSSPSALVTATTKRKLSTDDDVALRAAKSTKLTVIKEEDDAVAEPLRTKPPVKLSAHGIPLATAVGVLPVDPQQEEAKKRHTVTTIVTNPSMDLGPDLSSDEMVQMETIPSAANVASLSTSAKRSSQPGVPAPPSASVANVTAANKSQTHNSMTQPSSSIPSSSSSAVDLDDSLEIRQPAIVSKAVTAARDGANHGRRPPSAVRQPAGSSQAVKRSEKVPVQEQLTMLPSKPVIPFTQLAKPRVMATRQRAAEAAPQPPPVKMRIPSEGESESGSDNSDDDTRSRSGRRRRGSDTSSTRARAAVKRTAAVSNKSNAANKKALNLVKDERPPVVTVARRMETRRTKKDSIS